MFAWETPPEFDVVPEEVLKAKIPTIKADPTPYKTPAGINITAPRPIRKPAQGK